MNNNFISGQIVELIHTNDETHIHLLNKELIVIGIAMSMLKRPHLIEVFCKETGNIYSVMADDCVVVDNGHLLF